MIDGMALSTRERIVLVQVGDTQVLLGVAPGRVEAVHVLDKPVVTGGQEEMTGSFAARLREVLGKEQHSENYPATATAGISCLYPTDLYWVRRAWRRLR